MEHYLNVPQLCEMLAVKQGTIYSWVSRRKIPFVKINGLTRFKKAQIEQWLKEIEAIKRHRNFED